MKKFLFFSLLMVGIFCAPVSSFAALGQCSPIKCDPKRFHVSEMLTEDGITGGNKNDDGRFFSKYCYMCDTGGRSTQCNYNDTVVIAGEGGYNRAFQCADKPMQRKLGIFFVGVGVNDIWVELNESNMCTCGDSPLSEMTGSIDGAFLSEIREGECRNGSYSNPIRQSGRQDTVCLYRKCMYGYVAVGPNKCVKKESTQKTCWEKWAGWSDTALRCCDVESEATFTPDEKNKTGTCTCNDSSKKFQIVDGKGMCVKKESTQETCWEKRAGWSDTALRCCDVESEATFTPDEKNKTGTCTCNDSSKEFQIVKGKGMCVKKESTQKTCWEKRAGWPEEALRCCDTGNTAKLTPNNPNGKCICNDSSKEFQIVDGKGVCIDKNTTSPVTTPINQQEVCNNMFATVTISCTGNNTAMTMITSFMTECVSKNWTAEQILKAVTQIAAICQSSPIIDNNDDTDSAALDLARQRIESAVTELDRLSDSFKVSKWRNAEGKFNSARLASDSIAAVVLGATSGLITSKIIKKNQVEDGFEDLECHIGGQKVADWGDEFRAGIQ